MAVLADRNNGDTLLNALAKNGMKYGSHWLNYRYPSELYIVDRRAFDGVWDSFARLRTSATVCRKKLLEMPLAVADAKRSGKILK